MGELDTFTIGSKHDGVIPYDISTPQGVHADFLAGTSAYIAHSTVRDIVLVAGVRFIVQDFQSSTRCSRRSINLVSVVHLGDFDIESVIAEDLCRFAGEVKERIHSDGKVRRKDNGEFFGGGNNRGALFIGMASRSDDE